MEDVHLVPGPLKFSLIRNFVPGLLTGAFVLVGLAAPLAGESLEPAQRAPIPAVGPMDETAVRLEGGGLFRAYVTWLAEAHGHAALHGEDAPLPSQF